MIKNFAFGADPELFLCEIGGDKLISAVGKIGGSKKRPLKLDENGHCLQEDNVAVEFNIPPVKTPAEFRKEIHYMLDIIRKRTQGLYELAIDAAGMFADDQLQTDQALTFGCEPDFSAWDMVEQSPPRLPRHLENLRTCGGHIHVSWDDPDMMETVELVRAMDIFVGVPMGTIEPSNLRRQLYGKAGSFRFKDYGMEYRTLSNYWLRSGDYAEYVIRQTQKAIDFINRGDTVDQFDESAVKKAINENHFSSAHYLSTKYGVGSGPDGR